MDERHEIVGNEQPTAGLEPAEGFEPAAPETQEGVAAMEGDRPTAGYPPAEGAADTSGAQGTSGAGWQSSDWKVGESGARDWVGQLQGMIDNVAEHAGPVLREVAAKAAELAAVAAENAGPALHRAADVTTDVGHKVAVRSKGYAAELRRQQAEQAAPDEAAETSAGEPGTDETSGPTI